MFCIESWIEREKKSNAYILNYLLFFTFSKFLVLTHERKVYIKVGSISFTLLLNSFMKWPQIKERSYAQTDNLKWDLLEVRLPPKNAYFTLEKFSQLPNIFFSSIPSYTLGSSLLRDSIMLYKCIYYVCVCIYVYIFYIFPLLPMSRRSHIHLQSFATPGHIFVSVA